MLRQPKADSIRAKGLPLHVNEWCDAKGLPYTYADLENWAINGDEYGEPVTVEWLRRRFKTNRRTMEKWLLILEENRREHRRP